MAIHLKAFREELYLEHLEEAAFLYETRLAWLDDEELGWQDLEDLDLRIEAHVDGLMVGGNLALTLCIDGAAEADASTLHIIVRVFCRYKLVKHLSTLWEDFDFDDEEKVKSVSDALRWECPKDWRAPLLKVFSSKKTEMFPVLVSSVAYSSPNAGKQLVEALDRAKPEHLSVMLNAISRCNLSSEPKALTKISSYLSHKDEHIVEPAAKTLLVHGEARALHACRSKIGTLPELFAIAGSRSESLKLIEFAVSGKADANILLAIGLAGNLEAIPHLLAYLKHPDHGLAAAQALHLITGAPLFGDVHVVEKVEEEDLFEHELEPFKNGELPKNIDGDPFGEERQELSIDPQLWSQWLEENKSTYERGYRYRNGQKFSPAQLFSALLDNQTPTNVRRLAYDELVIRYKLDIRFVEDDPTVTQQLQLNEIYYWTQKNQSLFPEGRWYFAGNEMKS